MLGGAMELEEGLLEQLTAMGFSRDLSRSALRATGYLGVGEALDWLGTEMADLGTPRAYSRAAASAEEALVLHRGIVAGSPSPYRASQSLTDDDEALQLALLTSLREAEEQANRPSRTPVSVPKHAFVGLHAGIHTPSSSTQQQCQQIVV